MSARRETRLNFLPLAHRHRLCFPSPRLHHGSKFNVERQYILGRPDPDEVGRESIRGVIKIAVRVIVDRSGNVVAATLDNRASSKYFARAAMDAAKKWKFAPAADQASRVWLLHFEFARAGTAAHADALR